MAEVAGAVRGDTQCRAVLAVSIAASASHVSAAQLTNLAEVIPGEIKVPEQRAAPSRADGPESVRTVSHPVPTAPVGSRSSRPDIARARR